MSINQIHDWVQNILPDMPAELEGDTKEIK